MTKAGEMLRAAWTHRWGIAIAAQMAAAGTAGYLTTPQGSAQTWLYRAVVGEAIAGTAWFIAVYSRMHGWRSRMGRTILVKDLLLLAALTPTFLFLFFRLSRVGSHVVSGVDAATLSAIGLAMAWRIRVWQQEAAAPGELETRLAGLEAENAALRERLATEEK